MDKSRVDLRGGRVGLVRCPLTAGRHLSCPKFEPKAGAGNEKTLEHVEKRGYSPCQWEGAMATDASSARLPKEKIKGNS